MNRRSTTPIQRELAELIDHSETLMKIAADLKTRADSLRRQVESPAAKKAPSKKRGSKRQVREND